MQVLAVLLEDTHKCRMQHMHLYTGCMHAKLSYTRPNGLVYWPYTVSGFHV